MNKLYKVIGISKQAVHKQEKKQIVLDQKMTELVYHADLLREEHPGCGVEKMYYTLQPDFLGRDKFIELFMSLGYRLKMKKNYRRTTFSTDIYYPDLIKGMKVNAPSVIWQTDITYIYVPKENRFYYAVFIIDVYTKKIVGYKVSNHMRATANVEAFKDAIKNNKPPLIHHSDRGAQYTFKDYIKLLKDNNCQISMSKHAQENAYAERINRTIKEEYLDHWKPENFKQLKKYVKKAVKNYNEKRPHNNIGKISPVTFENNIINLPEDKRPTEIIYDYQ